MKILVTGYNGQLGFDIGRQAETYDVEIIGIDINDLDITKEQEVYNFIAEHKPDAIIHCAAYTAVDKAEDDQEQCWTVNVEGTRHLAQAARNVNAKFMYISTDYVFDGEGTDEFIEADKPEPVGYYGLTKYEGEKVIQSIFDEYFIVRISWVFGINGNNFVKTMLKLAESRDVLNVVADQIGSPTYTFDLARLLLDMIQTNQFGIYHATNEGFISWQEFAQEIFKLTGKNVTVNGITTDEYPTRAVRPKNSRMLKQKLVEAGFAPLPNWKDALQRYLKELTNEG